MDNDEVLIAAHFADSEGVQFQPWYWRISERVEFAKDMIEEHGESVLDWACQTEVILR
jgi:hypothetical protein